MSKPYNETRLIVFLWAASLINLISLGVSISQITEQSNYYSYTAIFCLMLISFISSIIFLFVLIAAHVAD